MILLTVGTQLPFDRLVRAVDQWAAEHLEAEIFAQIASGSYQPQHMDFIDYLDEQSYASAFDKATTVVAHAGMGTVISSLIDAKPVIVFPRKASLGEHRNEHQLATCQNLAHLTGCYITYDDADLHEALDNVEMLQGGSIAPYANDDLLNTIDHFIRNP